MVDTNFGTVTLVSYFAQNVLTETCGSATASRILFVYFTLVYPHCFGAWTGINKVFYLLVLYWFRISVSLVDCPIWETLTGLWLADLHRLKPESGPATRGRLLRASTSETTLTIAVFRSKI
jgi:hypothetical protein